MLNFSVEFNLASQFEGWYRCIILEDYHAFIFRNDSGVQCSRIFVKTVFSRS